MKAAAKFLFFFLFASFALQGSGVGAIYAEQAGRLDWKKTQIGRVTQAEFLPSFAHANATVRGVAVITDEKVSPSREPDKR